MSTAATAPAPASTQPAPAPSNPAPAPAPVNTAPAPAPAPATAPAPAPVAAQPVNPGFGGQAPAPANTGFGGADPTPPAAPAAVDPNSYTQFTLPQGVDPNSEATGTLMGHFKAAAGKRGMTQEQAQAALDLMTELNVHAEAHDSKQHESRVADWTSQAQQLGLTSQDTVMKANQGLTTLDPRGELRQVLNDTGLINHPVMFQVFAAFARNGGRPAQHVPNLSGQVQAGGNVTLAQALFPNGGDG